MLERYTRRHRRYTPSRKMEIVLAYRNGKITFEQIATIHSISREEFDSWCAYFDRGGWEALRATRVQDTLSGYFDEQEAA